MLLCIYSLKFSSVSNWIAFPTHREMHSKQSSIHIASHILEEKKRQLFLSSVEYAICLLVKRGVALSEIDQIRHKTFGVKQKRFCLYTNFDRCGARCVRLFKSVWSIICICMNEPRENEWKLAFSLVSAEPAGGRLHERASKTNRYKKHTMK